MGAAKMKTVTISVEPIEQTRRRFLSAFEGKREGAHISFPSVELLWKVLAPKRLELVRALAGAGPVSIREAARRVGRDVRAVHADVTALVRAGVLDKTAGGVEFSYDAIHIDFVLKAA